MRPHCYSAILLNSPVVNKTELKHETTFRAVCDKLQIKSAAEAGSFLIRVALLTDGCCVQLEREDKSVEEGGW